MYRVQLVTGLKIWHLRKETQFYPKKSFEKAMQTSTLILRFLFLPKHIFSTILQLNTTSFLYTK